MPEKTNLKEEDCFCSVSGSVSGVLVHYEKEAWPSRAVLTQKQEAGREYSQAGLTP